MSIQVVRPENRQEFMSKLVGPAYDPKEGKVQKPFSEPTKLGQPEENRAYQISVKNDTEKDFLLGMVAGVLAFGIPAIVYVWRTGGIS